MDIELLVVPDCPNEGPAAALLRQALDDLDLHDVSPVTRVIDDQREAERVGFTGPPTFLLDGRDPFADPGSAPGLTCRMYRTPDGLAGAPTLGQLRQVLERSQLPRRQEGGV